jgi:hypothetical protein
MLLRQHPCLALRGAGENVAVVRSYHQDIEPVEARNNSGSWFVDSRPVPKVNALEDAPRLPRSSATGASSLAPEVLLVVSSLASTRIAALKQRSR